MAIFVTLFAATEGELDRIFPGWPKPPEAPTLVRVDDPDTGEERTEKRWVPEGEVSASLLLADPQSAAEVMAPVLEPESEYERHMEERAPRVLRTLPHACLKHLFGRHLDALASLLLGRPIEARPARVTPDGFPIDRLAQEGMVALSRMSPTDLPQLAERWARGPAKGFEGQADALWALRRVHALAVLCTGTVQRSLCLWIES
ncbi:MAG: hypothetical protein HY898_31885 [Deltaproteobacteria bacterium]|nr:hypothetical protein [Deltaproteobacteria bacterium]